MWGRQSVVMLSPEPPYPLQGGGAFRTASLLHYFARFADIDLILISEKGQPALLPPGLVRRQQVIPLPAHRRSTAARYFRNARRAICGVPPLIDRLANLDAFIEHALEGQHYDFGIVEHFWCASYVDQLTRCCATTVLDLHNIESVLHERCAALNYGTAGGAVRAGHRRFAVASRRMESDLLPKFSAVLTTSEKDAAMVRSIAPHVPVTVYPNSLPWKPVPFQTEEPWIVFSGNFEYHPNIDAVRYLTSEIWPAVQRRYPDLELRLVGRGDRFVRHLIRPDCGIHTTGPVENALDEIVRARVVVAPLRAGSGTRVKILEAWAAARAVIATPIAAEGLDARDGDNIALASSAEEFVAAIDKLLGDPSARTKLGTGGRRTFESEYCWEAAWNRLNLDSQLARGAGLNRYTGES
jgi:glycosyltransferase involved in cell wall biosynthesis